MATIRSVADEAEVSIATVSRVLNNSGAVSNGVRERVLEAAGRLGYGAARRATSFIALAYTGPASLSSPYDVAILEGIAEAAAHEGFDLTITQLERELRSGEAAAQVFARKGVRGAIVRTTAETRGICRELAADGFPCIVVGDCFADDPAVSYAYADSKPTSREAVEHLISVGHRRIAVVISHIPDNDHLDRLLGYEQALKVHGIEVDPRLVHRVPAKRPDGAQVIRALMSLPDRPTAIFFADPLVAVGAINQAHAMGVRIPEDVSIVGFDDADVRGNVYPKMSAVCQDAHQLGREAAKALARKLHDPAAPVRMVLPTWLELHGTVGRPPASVVRVLPDGTRIDDGGPGGRSAEAGGAGVVAPQIISSRYR